MRGKPDTLTRDTVFSIQTFMQFGPTGPARKVLFDPAGREDFPAGWKLASERAPRYAVDMSAVFFGIREANRPGARVAGRGNPLVQPGAPGAGGTVNQPRGGGAGARGAGADSAADESSLILWHARDPRLQSQQIVQEQADRSFNYLAQYRFRTDRFVRLADDELRDVTLTTGERYAFGTDNREYQQPASYSGRNYQDVYTVDLETGARKLVMKKRPALGGMSSSPDGRKVLYWGSDGHYWTLDLATGDTVNITRGVPVTFVDTEDDHNNLYPPATPARGWSKDGASVLLYDNWDVWKVPVRPGSGPAVNLTGDGRQKQVRYQRIYQFGDEGAGGGGRGGGPGGRGGGPGGPPIDLSKPLYFGTYGEWTKHEGLSRVDPGKAGATSLFFEDARFNITKARDADLYTYTRQTFTEYPNYWVFNPGFKGGYPITDVNPQMKELAWSSGTRLIDYVSDKGDKLQGALYLPANYEPGKKYPLLVTIYEKRSQNKNSFQAPSDTRAPDPTLYTNRGYAVLDPDIVYRVNDPGMSAVWCVIPAVKAAIATGMIDEANIGLWGHSWGGYQTAFLVTQTNIFKAAIAGAPLTDMVSMYSSVYWNTGGANQAIFESSQGRFMGNFIDNYDAYIRNSPAYHAKNQTTPLIILHNDKDGAVDFNQGITHFNTLRQLGKDVILLEYVGENHGLARPVNQRDYASRMTEWFDHHLQGKPAADWIKNGVPRLRMQEHLLSRRDTTRIVS
jgi:dipeptidyl aminopeptidase/acylaminoacyl peptidase